MAQTLSNLPADFDFTSSARTSFSNQRIPPKRPPAFANAADIPGLVEAEAAVSADREKLAQLQARSRELAQDIAANASEREALRRDAALGVKLNTSAVTKLVIEERGLGDANEMLAAAINTATMEVQDAEEVVRRVLHAAVRWSINLTQQLAAEAKGEIDEIRPRMLTFEAWADEIHLATCGPRPSAAELRAALKI